MKNKIRLSESELVNLLKKMIQEQDFEQGLGYHWHDNKSDCPKKKSTTELLAHLKKQGLNNYFYCFNIPESHKSIMMSNKYGAFRWNKQQNVLELFKVKGPYLFFGGPYFGQKLGDIKMPKDFPSKFPRDFNEDNGDFPYWEITEGRVCLYVGGFC